MPERTNPRHSSFDYRSFAAYFVTICTHERRCLFGTVQQERMVLNENGRVVAEEWRRSEEMRDEVVQDAFIVMPNHLHGIVCLVPPEVEDVSPRGHDLDVETDPILVKKVTDDDVGTTGTEGSMTSFHSAPGRPYINIWIGILREMIAGFKAAVTTRINQSRESPGAPVWQSRYHDRILRNEKEWRARRRYIEHNPCRWAKDRHHPSAGTDGGC
jgi:REP element-mobilizing transposase RayT